MDAGKARILSLLTVLALAAVPPVASLVDQPFYVDLFARTIVFAIASLSLDFILGFAGLVSFGHALYLGVGAYTVGILSFHGINNGFVQFAAAVLASALVALVIGAISLRTIGVFFIMITLAFGQMGYFLAISINTYGGDDGLSILRHSEFVPDLNLGNPTVLYYFMLCFLALFLWVGIRVVNSRFGLLLQAIKYNERRMIAVGFPTFQYKLTAVVIAGAVCGLAGALFANLTLFVSPSIMHWFQSGDLIIMVIAGGMGTLIGPVLGAIVYLLLQHVLAEVTIYWPAIVAVILLLIVLTGKQGIIGLLSKRAVGHA